MPPRIPNLVTLVATVAALMATGSGVGRRRGPYPIETAIETACHSGQGGPGDAALLDRRQPHEPDAVRPDRRIGGALTVTGIQVVMR